MRSVLGGAVVLTGIGLVVAEAFDRSDYVTNQGTFVDQPVPFSHKHHVGDIGLDCRYCHTQVEKSAIAGIPSSEVCMTCHSQIWKNAVPLKPVRDSYASGKPIGWQKVTRLPDFVYFNHSIHVAKGVGCISCHGALENMSLTRLEHPMTMEFCLDCHRSPGKNLRSPKHLFDATIEKTETAQTQQLEQSLMAHYGVSTKTDCTTCHR